MSGDDGDDSRRRVGAGSEFIEVRVTEDVDGAFDFFGTAMWVTAVLEAPPSTSYELAAFLDEDHDQLACGTPRTVAWAAGSPAMVELEWGETGTLANGSDDDRTVVFEVRHVSGSCTDSWSFSVYGNR